MSDVLPDPDALPEGYAPVATSGFLSTLPVPDVAEIEDAPELPGREPITEDTAHEVEFPNLQLGDSGGKVQQLQYLLGMRSTGPFDGSTAVLVDRINARLGQPEDGVADAYVWANVLPKLKVGDQGPLVGSLQRLLGLDPLNRFDIETEAAVSKLQAANGDSETGLVGYSEWCYVLGIA